jgi:hypothetical protein
MITNLNGSNGLRRLTIKVSIGFGPNLFRIDSSRNQISSWYQIESELHADARTSSDYEGEEAARAQTKRQWTGYSTR